MATTRVLDAAASKITLIVEAPSTGTLIDLYDVDGFFIGIKDYSYGFNNLVTLDELNDYFTLPELYGDSWNIARGVAGVFGKQFFEYVEKKYPGMIKYVGQVNCGRHAQYQIISEARTDL